MKRRIIQHGEEKILVLNSPKLSDIVGFDKVICLVPLEPKDFYRECEAITITCTSEEELQEYIHFPHKQVKLRYITSGFSQRKFKLHCLLRGWEHYPIPNGHPPPNAHYVDYIKTQHWKFRASNPNLRNSPKCKLKDIMPVENFEFLTKSNLQKTFKGLSFIPETFNLTNVDEINYPSVIKLTTSFASTGTGNYYVRTTEELLAKKDELDINYCEFYDDNDQWITIDDIKDYKDWPLTVKLPSKEFIELNNKREIEAFVESHTLSNYVVQRYISRPLLYKGKKCHVRPLILVTDELNFFVFDRMRIYTASQLYIEGDLSKENVDSHAKSTEGNPYYDIYEDAHTSPNNLTGVNSEPVRDSSRKENINDPRVRKLVFIIIKTIISTIRDLNPYEETEHSYHILAPDIIFSDDYHPYLLEVNRTPSLEASKEFSAMLCDWEYRCGIEPIFNPITYIKYEELTGSMKRNFDLEYDITENCDVAFQDNAIIGYISTENGELKIGGEREIMIKLLEPYKMTKLKVAKGIDDEMFRWLQWSDFENWYINDV